MKRLSYILLVMLVFLFASCHGKIESNAFVVPSEFDTSKNYTVTFWAKNDSNVTQRDIYRAAVAEFNEIYPNITVELRSYDDYTKIYNDVITNLTTDTTPNVCITYPDFVATYMQRDNVIVCLDDLMTNEKYGLGGSEVRFDSVPYEKMIDKFLNECYLNGGHYSIPYMRSSEATYINKTYVNELGFDIPDVLTWDYIWEVCTKAKEGYLNGENDIVYPLIYKSTDNMFIQMAKQYGIDYTTENGDVLLFNDKTTDFLLDLYQYAKDERFQTFKNVSYPGNFFNRGQCIFAIDSTAGATWIGTNAPNLDIHQTEVVDFETVVRGVPQKDANDIKMISQGPSICIFNKEDPQEVLASWLFTQYLLTNKVQVAYSETEGYVPVTYSAIESSEYQDYLSKRGLDNDKYYDVKIDASKVVTDNISNTFITPVFNGSSLVRSASGSLIEEIFKPRFKANKEYIESFYDNLSTLYKLNEIQTNTNANKLGPLPKVSIILISILSVIWIGIGAYYLVGKVKKKKS